jgi:hypothetical protein
MYNVGFHTEDITPPLELKPRLGGYLRIFKYANGVRHPLMARAFCLRDPSNSEKSIILISNDLVGFQYNLAKIVRKIISRQTGIPLSHIMLHFTHSHTSPDMIGIFPNYIGQMPRTDVQYPVAKHMMKHMIRAGIQAFRNATIPAKIGFGFTRVPEPPIAVQRRPPYRQIKTPIRVIKITSEKDDSLLGILVNYQGHPTQLPQSNNIISTEYPGQVAEALYRHYPNLPFAAYFNGFIGDVSIPGYKGYFSYIWKALMEKAGLDWQTMTKEQRKMFIRKIKRAPRDPQINKEAMDFAFKEVEALGEKFAEYVIGCIDKIATSKIEQVVVHRRFLFPEAFRIIPIRKRVQYYKSLYAKLLLVQNEFLNKLRIAGLLYGYYLMNGRPLAMLNLKRNGHKFLHQTEAYVFKINDIYWFASPGEPFIMYSDLLSNMVPDQKAFFNCMANDTCGYIFPWSFHVRGGYEQTFSFDMLYGKYLLKTFKEELAKILKE